MKTYMEPTLQVINIETQQMLATSAGVQNTNATQDSDGNYNSLSRGGSWDDEEDEDW